MNIRISAADLINLYRLRVAAVEDDLGLRAKTFLESKFPDLDIEIPSKKIGNKLFKILSKRNPEDLNPAIELLFSRLEKTPISVDDLDVALGELYTIAKTITTGGKPVSRSTKEEGPTLESETIRAIDFGKSVVKILEDQFLGEIPKDSPAKIGQRLIEIAKNQLAGNPQKAYETIQDLLRYFVESKTDFTEGAEDIDRAIRNIYGHLKRRSMSRSKSERVYKHKSDIDEYASLLYKKEMVDSKSFPPGKILKWTDKDKQRFQTLGNKLKSEGVDISRISPKPGDVESFKREEFAEEAFGTRSESGISEGGIEKIPEGAQKFLQVGDEDVDSPSEQKDLISVLHKYFPIIKSSLDDKEELLFELIAEEGGGVVDMPIKVKKKDGTITTKIVKKQWKASLLPGDKENMNLGAKWQEVCAISHPDWVTWYQDRPARLTKLRETLLEKVQDFIDNKLPKEDYDYIFDKWHSSSGKKIDREYERFQYERGRQERKKQKLEEKITTQGLSPKEEADIERYNAKFILEDEFGKLKYFDDIRLLTSKEQSRLDELPKLLKKFNVVVDNVPKIPPKEPTAVEYLMWLNHLEKINALTPSLNLLMDKVYDEALDMFDGDSRIVRSIIDESPTSAELKQLNQMAKGLSQVKEEKVRIKDLPKSQESKGKSDTTEEVKEEDISIDDTKKEAIEKIKSMLAQIKRVSPAKYPDLIKEVKSFADGKPPARLKDKNYWKDLEADDFKRILESTPGATELLEEASVTKTSSLLERIAFNIMSYGR